MEKNKKIIAITASVLAVLALTGGTLGVALTSAPSSHVLSSASASSSASSTLSKETLNKIKKSYESSPGLPKNKNGKNRTVDSEHPFVSTNDLTNAGEAETAGFKKAVSNLPIPDTTGEDSEQAKNSIQSQDSDNSKTYSVSILSSWNEVNKTVTALKKIGWTKAVQNSKVVVLSHGNTTVQFGTGNNTQFVMSYNVLNR